jgi:hypothetical protein
MAKIELTERIMETVIAEAIENIVIDTGYLEFLSEGGTFTEQQLELIRLEAGKIAFELKAIDNEIMEQRKRN